MRISPSTIAWAAIASASMALLYADPWRDDAPDRRFVSTRSAAQRLFAPLQDREPRGAEIILAPADAAPVRIVPSGDGHELRVGDALLGPVDPDALDGLWSSLRLATSLRAVPEDVETTQRTGAIEVVLGDQTLRLELGGTAPGEAGLYGTLVTTNAQGADTSTWVVEEELGLLLEQSPLAWLARRLLVLEPNAVQGLRWNDIRLQRGADVLWRQVQGPTTALLNTDAVDARLARLSSARLEPVLDPEHAPPRPSDAEPWLTIEVADGSSLPLVLGPPCPGYPERIVVWRGAGWPGCIDAALVEPWPLPGTDLGGAVSLIEPRLLPHPLRRVLRIEQERPEPRTLVRAGGDFRLEDRGPNPSTAEVTRPQVERWYDKLHNAEVEPAPRDIAFTPDTDLRIETDATVAVRLRCDHQPSALLCQRDDGPLLRVLDADVRTDIAAELLAPRELFAVPPGEARAIEILPGPEGETVRQSAHLDLGVWRLDAPAHPDDDAALDEVALEELLAAFASPQIRESVPVPKTPPERIINVERTPRRGQSATVRVALHPGCIAVHEGQAVVLATSTCEPLSSDLVFTDSLRKWLQNARSLELNLDPNTGETVRLRRQSGSWTGADGPAMQRALTQLQRLEQLELGALRSGTPPGEAELTLRILPERGEAFEVELGESWLRVVGRDWYYEIERR